MNEAALSEGSSSSGGGSTSRRTRSSRRPGGRPRHGERDFCQGLVHVAVAWYQAGRGKRTGCERQLEKARRRLSPYAPAHRGVDVSAVLAQVDRAAERVAAGSLDLDPVRL